jgi:hypothetical protein
MLIRNKFNGYSSDGVRLYPGGGGGTNTSYTSNIPEYLQPYAETMLGATQQQLFNTKDGQVTGFRPFAPYGAAVDDQGNILNTAQEQAKTAVAGFSPLQQQALSGMANMRLPGQTEAASQMSADLAGRSLGAGSSSFNDPATSLGGQSTAASYMSPYMQNVVDIQKREAQTQADIASTQRGAQAVGAGAFGGSRHAIMDAQAARNLAQQKGDIQAQGSQAAYQQAQAQFNAEQQRKMQGVQQAGSMAGQLGALGQQQYGQQMGLLGAQSQAGAQQQQLEQARINQAMQNYATQQQYPLMQLGVMSNMLRGLPMQASTTSSYAAQPSIASQFAGAAGTGMQIANQAKQFLGAKGGEVKNGRFKSMAAGGIATGVDPEEMPYIAKKMGDQQIGQKLSDAATDNETKNYLKAEADFRKQARSNSMAGGGIIAFKEGSEEAVSGDRQLEGILAGYKDKLRGEASPVAVPPADVAAPAAVVEAPPVAVPPAVTPGGIAVIPELKATDAETKLTGQLGAREAEANKTLEQRLQEQNALKKKFGIDPQFLQDAIDKQEKRKTDLQGEAKEEAMNRFTEFLMTWGSTPGPTMVAAAKAGREYIANTNLDKKERKRLLAEADGVITDLNKSIYLEKSGSFKDAQAEQIRAGEVLFSLTNKLADLQGARASTEFGQKAAAVREGAQADANYRKMMQEAVNAKTAAAIKAKVDMAIKMIEVNKPTDQAAGVEIMRKAMVQGGATDNDITRRAALEKYLEAKTLAEARFAQAGAATTTAEAGKQAKIDAAVVTEMDTKSSRDALKAARAADKNAGKNPGDEGSATRAAEKKIRDAVTTRFDANKSTDAKPAAPAAAPAADAKPAEYEVGKIYQDASGKKAKYTGNRDSLWEDVK